MSNKEEHIRDILEYIDELSTTDIPMDDWWFSVKCEFYVTKEHALDVIQRWKSETCYDDNHLERPCE